MKEADKLVVFVTHSPLDADEYVWIDTDFEKEIDAELVQKPSPYKVDKIIYLVNRTTELDNLYKKLSKEEFKKLERDKCPISQNDEYSNAVNRQCSTSTHILRDSNECSVHGR